MRRLVYLAAAQRDFADILDLDVDNVMGSMLASEAFGFCVRLLGVIAIAAAWLDLVGGVLTGLGVNLKPGNTLGHDLAAAADYVVLGALLFFGADWITRLAYRK